MLGTAKLAAFVATANAEKAREFYENALGLTFVSDEFYALVFEANGTMLRLQKVAEVAPHQYTALGWHVTDIRAAIEELSAKGVIFEKFPGFPQDDLGIMTFESGTQVAWFKDPDGNILSLDQM
jgi:catechol 2,3-dioxygenase-like lactoylglutathione lyase family enzyme